MSNSLVDWWTVRGERWGIRNVDFKIELARDESTNPLLMDDYTEADLLAFEQGEWQFVALRVVPVDRDLNDLIGAEKGACGVDWGDLPQGRIDRDDLTDAQVRDLALQSVQTLRSVGVMVETERDSEFALGRTLAPF